MYSFFVLEHDFVAVEIRAAHPLFRAEKEFVRFHDFRYFFGRFVVGVENGYFPVALSLEKFCFQVFVIIKGFVPVKVIGRYVCENGDIGTKSFGRFQLKTADFHDGDIVRRQRQRFFGKRHADVPERVRFVPRPVQHVVYHQGNRRFSVRTAYGDKLAFKKIRGECKFPRHLVFRDGFLNRRVIDTYRGT